MWLLMALTIFFLAVNTALWPVQKNARETPAAKVEASAQISNLRMFAYAAQLYLTNNPSYTGTLYWADIKTQTTLGSGHQNASIPSNWKVVVASSSDYVLCTEMTPSAGGAIGQFMPEGYGPVYLNSSNAIVVPSTTGMSITDLQTQAAKCN